MITRTDFSTPEKNGKPETTFSTGLGEEQESYFTTKSVDSTNMQQDVKVSPFDFNNLPTNQRKLTMRMKQEEKLRKRKMLKEALNKMMMTSYSNRKLFFVKIREIPQRYQDKQDQSESTVDKLAKQFIFKTPITAETALLRSVINMRSSQTHNRKQEAQNKIQGSRKNSISNLSHSLIIYPSEHLQLQAMEKSALLFLQQLAKNKISKIISCFRKNSFNSTYIKTYIRKCIINLKQNQLNFLRKLRVMTQLHREIVISTKRKSVQSLLTKCLQRRDKLIVQNLKACHQQKLLKRLVSLQLLSRSQKYQKLSAFFAIYREACRNSKQKISTFQSWRQSAPLSEHSSIRNLRFQIENLRKSRN